MEIKKKMNKLIFGLIIAVKAKVLASILERQREWAQIFFTPICFTKDVEQVLLLLYIDTVMKKIVSHIALAVAFALISGGITELSIKIFPDIGWSFLTVFYVSILFLQILFYVLLSYNSFSFSVLNFVVNFILWVAEQVNIERVLHDSFFYQSDKWTYGVLALGGLLWALNKLMIDWLLKRINVKLSSINRFERITGYHHQVT